MDERDETIVALKKQLQETEDRARARYIVMATCIEEARVLIKGDHPGRKRFDEALGKVYEMNEGIPPVNEVNVIQTRIEDMGSGRLNVSVQPDGDVVFCILRDIGMLGLEFCIPGSGGGKSPNTYKALRHLYEAMKLDNLEN